MKAKTEQKVLYRIGFFVLICGSVMLYKAVSTSDLAIQAGNQIRLLTETEVDSSEMEGTTVEKTEQEEGGDVCIGEGTDSSAMFWWYCFVVFYMFLGLAIICDDFFVPALEEIGEGLDMKPDVAGATLMAMGGSAPEFFTALIGAFKESDVGFGTIVGSAVFNVLFVIGACILFAKETLVLSWYPLTRDCIWYTISLIILSVFFSVISPSYIEWWESVCLIAIYAGYIHYMMNNQAWEKKFTGHSSQEEAEKQEQSIELKEALNSAEKAEPRKSDASKGSNKKYELARSASVRSAAKHMAEDDDEEPSAIGKFFMLLALPMTMVFKAVIPNPQNHKLLAFIASIAFIALMTYFMVNGAEIVGNTLGIPIVIMGITVLATGTSVPDLISSVIVARKGEGDMALSSSIGSNIFDILIGLPVPWLLYSVTHMKPVHVYSDNLIVSIMVLILMEVSVIFTIKVCDWKMNPKMGLLMFAFYGVFMAQDLYRAKWTC